MGGPKSKATKTEILAAFATEEPFKAFAARIGMSPNTLRGIWKAEFGETAFVERGKRLQAKAAAETVRTRADSSLWVWSDVPVICLKCGKSVVLKSNQTAQMDVSAFVCDSCRFDRKCPVCGLAVDGERGMASHFRHRRDAGDLEHGAFKERAVGSFWEGKSEGEDYVVCRECGHRAETLAGHLTAAHGFDADAYRARHGSGVPVRADKVARNMSEAAKVRGVSFGTGKGERKTAACPSCGAFQEVSKFLVPGTHDLRCAACRKRDEDFRWEGKTEPEDFVSCRECSYKAENLVSHFMAEHPGYRTRHPDAPIVALRSAVRDKSAIRGVPRPPEFGEKIRATKTLALALDDFRPFLEPDGTVDHIGMSAATGHVVETLAIYAKALGLRFTRKWELLAEEARRRTLTAADLEPFKLKNGKVSIALATLGLKACNVTVKKECRRLGLEWAHNNPKQHKFMALLSEALGNVPYVEEWMSWRFVNPLSSFRFKFDGHFKEIGLVVEFHGFQHYTFPNFFMPHESYRPLYDAMRERDRIKKSLIDSAPDLVYFEVLEDEPWEEPAYLKGRLVQAGVLPRVP